MKTFFIFLTILAGCVLPFQGSINGRLGKSIGSPVFASLISFLIGTIALFIYGLITHSPLKLQSLKQLPLYEWTGGLFGAFYVLVVVLMLPRLGAALTFSLIVGGQMVVSTILDHTGVLVTVPHPINVWRIAGLGLIILGVIIVRKF